MTPKSMRRSCMSPKACVLLLALALAGCGDPPMTNEQIIQQTKLCEDAGMRARQALRILDEAVVRVQCAPKENQ